MEHEAEPGQAEAEPGPTGAEPGPTGAEPGPTEAEPAETAAEQATGELRVDATLKLLERLPGMPVSDHPELFEQVHARLSEVLDELESGPGAAGPAGG